MSQSIRFDTLDACANCLLAIGYTAPWLDKARNSEWEVLYD